MEAMLVLIGGSLLVAVGFLIAFVRSSQQGDFEDMVTPSVRMLSEEKEDPSENITKPIEIP